MVLTITMFKSTGCCSEISNVSCTIKLLLNCKQTWKSSLSSTATICLKKINKTQKAERKKKARKAEPWRTWKEYQAWQCCQFNNFKQGWHYWRCWQLLTKQAILLKGTVRATPVWWISDVFFLSYLHCQWMCNVRSPFSHQHHPYLILVTTITTAGCLKKIAKCKIFQLEKLLYFVCKVLTLCKILHTVLRNNFCRKFTHFQV